MDAFGLLLKLSHVVLAILLVAGILGRWILLRRAERTDDVEREHLLAGAAAPFEGRIFESAMTEARAEGRVTDALRAAWRDPAVAFARRYELAAVTIIVALMVLKPF